VVAGVTVYAGTQRWRPALATAVAVVLAWIGGRVIKAAVARSRPPGLLDGVELREDEVHSYGYVSGHTSVAFALATVLTALLPGRWRWLPYPVAGLVGLARMFFGVHLPLDVLGGAGLGVVCGVVALVAFRVVGPGRAHAAERPGAEPPADPADQPAGPSSSG
jgi:glycosyltransferase 2 family protein